MLRRMRKVWEVVEPLTAEWTLCFGGKDLPPQVEFGMVQEGDTVPKRKQRIRPGWIRATRLGRTGYGRSLPQALDDLK